MGRIRKPCAKVSERDQIDTIESVVSARIVSKATLNKEATRKPGFRCIALDDGDCMALAQILGQRGTENISHRKGQAGPYLDHQLVFRV